MLRFTRDVKKIDLLDRIDMLKIDPLCGICCECFLFAVFALSTSKKYTYPSAAMRSSLEFIMALFDHLLPPSHSQMMLDP